MFVGIDSFDEQNSRKLRSDRYPGYFFKEKKDHLKRVMKHFLDILCGFSYGRALSLPWSCPMVINEKKKLKWVSINKGVQTWFQTWVKTWVKTCVHRFNGRRGPRRRNRPASRRGERNEPSR